MLYAESRLDPFAIREGVWPDVSYGMAQITVSLAANYGIGDGRNTAQNRACVKAAFFDRATAIRVGAMHLLGCWLTAEGYRERELMALRVYNGGGYGLSESYEQHYAGNIENYRAALAWAAGLA